MNDSPQYATFRDYLAVVRKHRWSVLFITLLFGGGALAFSLSVDPRYRAEASLEYREPTQDVEFIGLPPIRNQTPEARAATGAERAVHRQILERVRKRLKLREPVKDLEERVQARADVRTNLVVIEAEDSDPVVAARVANEVGRLAIEFERTDVRKRYDSLIRSARHQYRTGLRGKDPVTELQRRGFQQQLVQLRTTRQFANPADFNERAQPPSDPVFPKKTLYTVLGVLMGLLLGVMLAFVRSTLDRRLRGVRDIQEEADLPLLGVVRKSALGQVNVGDPQNGYGEAEVDLEAFRIVQAHVEHLQSDHPPRRILVTSPLPEEGKSTVAASLAVVSGLAGRRTVLVECDLRRPVLAKRFGLDPAPGLADVLTGASQAPEAIRSVLLPPALSGNGAAESGAGTTGATLSVITAGSEHQRPAELLASRTFTDFVSVLSRNHDLIVLDSTPLLAVSDSLDLVEHVEAVVLCVRSNRTTRDQLLAALATLQGLPPRAIGVVVTGVEAGDEGEYGSYAYSYAGYYRR